MNKVTDELGKIVYPFIMESKTKEQITPHWKKFFTIYLNALGFNNEAIERLFEWGNGGHNWKALNKNNQVVSLEGFQMEVEYIFDRMSLDRLFRAHWEFNHIDEE